jgi:ABC-2 type transport system permease protein
MYCCLLFLSAINIAFLFVYSHPDWKPMLVSYLGLLLQGAALLAIGTFISTLTKNQIIAGAATFGACLLIFVCGWIGEYNSETWARVLAYLSVSTHMESFTRGTLDSKDAIYYVTVIFVGLFLTARSMESLRWRS